MQSKELYEEVNQDSDDNQISKSTSLIEHFKGYLFGILAAANYCVGNIVVKWANELSPTDHLVVLYTVQFIFMIGYALCKKQHLFGEAKNRKILILRGLIQPAAVGLLYCGLKLLPPSDVVAINHISIIFTAILSRIFLNERLGPAHLIGILLTIFGVTFISKPTFFFGKEINQISNLTNITYLADGNDKLDHFWLTLGVLLSLLSAFCWGIVRLLTKKTTNVQIHWSITNLFTSYFGLPISLILSIVLYSSGITSMNLFQNFSSVNFAFQVGLSVISASFKLVGAIFYVIAFSHEEATKVSIATTTDLVLAFFLQALILNVQIDILSVLGSLFILFGSVVILVYKLFEFNYSKKFQNEQKLSLCEKVCFYKF